jgi:DNA repair photolyase
VCVYICIYIYIHTHHTNTHIPGVNVAMLEDVLEFAATELAALDKPARQIGVGAQEVMDL